MPELADRFFAEEADDHVRPVLDEQLRAGSSGAWYFTFNVFNVRLDFDQGMAVIEDELDPPRSESLPLEDFRKRVGS